MADTTHLTAHTEVPDHAGEGAHVGPSALGLSPSAWVALAMIVLILVALFLKVPGAIAKNLDNGISEIRRQLDEAKALRAEAEALRKEYADKIANAERDAAAMIEHARHEAEAIVAKAEANTSDVIARREKMAQDKIAAAELAAVSELRTRAANAAARAATGLIARNHSAQRDEALVNQAIASI